MNFAASTLRRFAIATLGLAGLVAAPLSAQVEQIDPDAAYSAPIDGDIEENPGERPVYADPQPEEPNITYSPPASENTGTGYKPVWQEQEAEAKAAPSPEASAEAAVQSDDGTYREDDLIGAAQGVFGKGARGVAKLIQNILSEQGEPNAYIVGREAGGAFIVGARYGSGTLYHKVEGERPVYWTGPSIGFDAGANAGSTFVLVYNLYDSEELYERYPAGEGQVYVVGGLHASYMRKGDVVLIPIRMGAGLRLGVNAGYMKFSKKQRWLPF